MIKHLLVIFALFVGVANAQVQSPVEVAVATDIQKEPIVKTIPPNVLPGKYDGSITGNQMGISIGVVMEITKIEQETVVAVLRVNRSNCTGPFQATGKMEDGILVVKAISAQQQNEGSNRGCGGITVRVTPDGNRLHGTWGTNKVTFTRT